MTPEENLGALLSGAGLGLTAGSNLFYGPVRAAGGGVPAQAVFLLGLGGPRNSHLTGGGTKSNVIHLVQVRIRAEVGGAAVGDTLARAALAAVDAKTPTDFAYSRSLQPSPIALGEDAEGHPEWSFNVALGAVVG